MSLGGEEDLRNSVVRLRGLPFSATEEDVQEFFKGLELGPDGVVIQLNYQGRSTGQAFVQFSDSEAALKALEKNRQHMGSRYIEVFKGHVADMQAALRMVGRTSSTSANHMAPPVADISRPVPVMESANPVVTGVPGMGGSQDMLYSGVVRVRGLPYSCTLTDISAFFNGIPIAPDGIFVVTHPDGRPSGEAYVEFISDEASARALQLHKGQMGSRYIEIFRSTKGEMMAAVQQKMYGMYQAGTYMNQMGVVGVLSPYPLPLEPSVDNVCLKLRGLPFSATQEDILTFFQGYQVASNGVHIVLSGERPSGEAFVEFVSSEEAARAMERNRHNIGARYIELFRAAKSEALMAMTGGAGYGMDPASQLLLLQQQQQQQMAAMGMVGWGAGGEAANGSAVVQYGYDLGTNPRPHS